MGNLVLNNVTVEYNKCVKEYWGSDDYTAKGGGGGICLSDNSIYGTKPTHGMAL